MPSRLFLRSRSRALLREAGFTLTEMMVSVVIIGILAAIATPLLFKDARGAQTREFASDVARSLQQAHMQAISSRLPIDVYIYADRVLFSSATAPANVSLPLIPASIATPYLMIQAREHVKVLDVTATTTPPGAQVLAAYGSAVPPPVTLQLLATGGVNFIGQPNPTTPYMWIRNENITSGSSADFHFRIDLTPLTGFVRLVNTW